MPLTRFAFLFTKYYQKTATAEEAEEFIRLAAMDEHAVELQRLLEEAWDRPDAAPVFSEAESEALLADVLRTGREAQEGREAKVIPMDVERVEPLGRRRRWVRFAAAAVVVGAVGLGGFLWVHRGDQLPVAGVRRPVVTPVAVPGGNKAVLILSDGSAVTLDSTKNGFLTTQGTTHVVKVAGGQLAYANDAADGARGTGTGAAAPSPSILYNTVRTPRGGQYQVTLPDGSRVWLNAATSLRFPTAFTGTDRTVELSGEAYFEIASRKDQPFRVKVREMTVDVLGTHFNVMAYDDEESFRTTLLTGAVRVEGGETANFGDAGTQRSVQLKPGEEARLSLDTKAISVAEADTDQCVAWKNGLFQFEGASLENVMRQVARWYDVDVHYTGTIERHFSGMISRNAPLANVLHVLERAGKTSFTLEGRTVTVKPK